MYVGTVCRRPLQTFLTFFSRCITTEQRFRPLERSRTEWDDRSITGLQIFYRRSVEPLRPYIFYRSRVIRGMCINLNGKSAFGCKIRVFLYNWNMVKIKADRGTFWLITIESSRFDFTLSRETHAAIKKEWIRYFSPRHRMVPGMRRGFPFWCNHAEVQSFVLNGRKMQVPWPCMQSRISQASIRERCCT